MFNWGSLWYFPALGQLKGNGLGPPPAGGAVEQQAVKLTRGRQPQLRVRWRGQFRGHRDQYSLRGPTAPTPSPESGSSRSPGTGAFVIRTDRRSSLEGSGREPKRRARRWRVEDWHTSQRSLSREATFTDSNSHSHRHSVAISGAPSSLAPAFTLSPQPYRSCDGYTLHTHQNGLISSCSAKQERNNLRQHELHQQRGHCPSFSSGGPTPTLCEHDTGNPSLTQVTHDSWQEHFSQAKWSSLKINIFHTNGPKTPTDHFFLG